MLNIPELTIANPFLPTTDYDAITDNQAENISVAFTNHKASIKNDSTLQQLYTQAKPLGKLKNNGKYYKLQEMSINDMPLPWAYHYDPQFEGYPLNLRKIAVMPTLHYHLTPRYTSATVLEVFTQLPDNFLQNVGSVFFYTDFPKKLLHMPSDSEKIEYYGGEEEVKKFIQPASLIRYHFHLGKTTFFKLEVESLQDIAIKTIIKQMSQNGYPLKSSIKKLPLPPVLIKDIGKLVY